MPEYHDRPHDRITTRVAQSAAELRALDRVLIVTILTLLIVTFT